MVEPDGRVRQWGDGSLCTSRRDLEELYEAIFATNVKGVLFTVQKALPHLPDGASIILNALISGSKGLASNMLISHPEEITPLILEAAGHQPDTRPDAQGLRGPW